MFAVYPLWPSEVVTLGGTAAIASHPHMAGTDGTPSGTLRGATSGTSHLGTRSTTVGHEGVFDTELAIGRATSRLYTDFAKTRPVLGFSAAVRAGVHVSRIASCATHASHSPYLHFFSTITS